MRIDTEMVILRTQFASKTTCNTRTTDDDETVVTYHVWSQIQSFQQWKMRWKIETKSSWFLEKLKAAIPATDHDEVTAISAREKGRSVYERAKGRALVRSWKSCL